MKKIIGLGLMLSTVLFAEEFNLDTEIKGEIKKTYGTDRKILDEKIEVSPEDAELKKVEVTNKVKVDNVKGEVKKVELNIDEKPIDLGIDLENETTEIDSLIDEAESDNYVRVGAGGFDRIDSFMYGIKYSGEVKDKDLTYKINLDRDIRGEDKEHSDISKDYFGAEIDYKKYNIDFEHKIKDQEYTGGGDRKLTETELNLKYAVKDDPKNNIYLGFDLYRGDSESATSERDYTNLYFNVYGEYDKLFKQNKLNHIFSTKGGYYIDDLESTNTNVLYVGAKDKLKHSDFQNYEFNFNADLEVINKDVEDNKTGISLGAEAVRKMNDNFNISLFAESEQKNTVTKDIMNGLAYVDDILMFKNSSGDETELKVEDNFAFGTGINYTKENLYGEAILKYVTSKDKINYQQVSLGKEKVIQAGNYDDTLKWFEVQGKAAYSFNNFRGEIVAKYSGLDELAYVPEFTTRLSGIYDKDKMRAQIDLNTYSDMYSEVEGTADRYKLSGYSKVDFTYTYRFSSNIESSLIVTNVLGADEEIMENYEIDERKITLEAKVKY